MQTIVEKLNIDLFKKKWLKFHFKYNWLHNINRYKIKYQHVNLGEKDFKLTTRVHIPGELPIHVKRNVSDFQKHVTVVKIRIYSYRASTLNLNLSIYQMKCQFDNKVQCISECVMQWLCVRFCEYALWTSWCSLLYKAGRTRKHFFIGYFKIANKTD